MKFTTGLQAKFPDPDQERVRANTDQRITELQTTVLPLLTQPGVVAIQKFTASGQYAPTSGASRGFIIQCGGGGAGGGATAVGATLSLGGGGASGITVVDYLPRLATGGTVTIGAGGAPGAAGAAGNNGGDTTTVINGVTRVAKGGGGGGAGSQSGNPGNPQGAGGNVQAGSTPGLWVTGEYGMDGLITSATGGGLSAGSHPGSGALGVTPAGGPTGFGAGGLPGVAVAAAVAGFAGGAGVVIIVELI